MKTFRLFFSAFTISLCVLGLGAGLLTVGYNSRRVAEGETAPHPTYRLERGVLLLSDGSGGTVRVPVLQEEAPAAAAVPAPVRVSAHFLRALAAVADKAAQHLCP